MQICRNKETAAGALIGLALGFLILPLRWLLAALAAGAFHEFCHWAAVRLCGGQVGKFQLSGSGAVMEAENLSRGKEFICTLAGPLGGLLLLLISKWFPAIAVCGLLQSAYNLLPIYPLDGGRALRCCAGLLFSPKIAHHIVIWTERLCLTAIIVTAIYAAVFLKLGIMPVLLAAALFAKKNSLQTEANKSTIGLPF